MRRKITEQTQKTVAFAVIAHILRDRDNPYMQDDEGVTLDDLCDVISQCGISPEALAMGCIANTSGSGREGVTFIDELDQKIARKIGEDYAMRFVDRAIVLDKFFADGKKKLIESRIAGRTA